MRIGLNTIEDNRSPTARPLVIRTPAKKAAKEAVDATFNAIRRTIDSANIPSELKNELIITVRNKLQEAEGK